MSGGLEGIDHRFMVMVYKDVEIAETDWFQRVVRRRKTRRERNVVYCGVVVGGQFERSMNGPVADAHIVGRDVMTFLSETEMHP